MINRLRGWAASDTARPRDARCGPRAARFTIAGMRRAGVLRRRMPRGRRAAVRHGAAGGCLAAAGVRAGVAPQGGRGQRPVGAGAGMAAGRRWTALEALRASRGAAPIHPPSGAGHRPHDVVRGAFRSPCSAFESVGYDAMRTLDLTREETLAERFDPGRGPALLRVHQRPAGPLLRALRPPVLPGELREQVGRSRVADHPCRRAPFRAERRGPAPGRALRARAAGRRSRGSRPKSEAGRVVEGPRPRPFGVSAGGPGGGGAARRTGPRNSSTRKAADIVLRTASRRAPGGSLPGPGVRHRRELRRRRDQARAGLQRTALRLRRASAP